MTEAARPAPARIAVGLAFAAVYIIWGSTYLAIRVAVETIPPFVMAGVRYLLAGAVLYAWVRYRGVAAPARLHWRSAFFIGGLLLLGGNGGVVWAEQPGKIPSGIAALMVSAVPLWMVLINWLRPRGIRPTGLEALGLILGFAGVVLLINPGSVSASAPIDRGGAIALILAPIFWASGSIYSRHAKLPESALLGTGMQMLMGGSLLILAGLVTGEWSRINVEAISLNSILAFAYLVVFGALVGFTAYIWLLKVSTPAKVGTYAYVNPAIAVLLGWMILREPITPTTLIAMAVILAGVIAITARAPSKRAESKTPRPPEGDPQCVDATESAGTTQCERPGSFSIERVRNERLRQNQPYFEFFRSEAFSAGLYVLPAGGIDRQQLHTEDELYYIVSGRAVLRVGERDQAVGPGSIEFVRAGVEHRFHTIEKELETLVFFAPPEGSMASPSPELFSAVCDKK